MRQLARPTHQVVASLLYSILLLLMPPAWPAWGQSQAPSASYPHLVKFSGVVKDVAGKTQSGVVGVTFALYKDQQGGAPLWLETQNVQVDGGGRYTVFLGASKSEGLPQELFVSGEARWLGVQPEGGTELPRTLLLSVPYALKAGDAATVGGLPPSAFVLAAPGGAGTGSAGNGSGSSNNLIQPPVGGSGTQNFIPLWIDNSGNLGNSVLFQSGSGSTAKTGVNTASPAATLDVNGNTIARGAVQLPSTGTANASQGFNSQPFSLQGSAFNSSTQQAIGPVFQWQTEPAGNNTSSPSGTLNLLYGTGSGSATETGLNIASNGKITFANGQTFPGTGTITGVTAGTGLTGGGTSGNVTLAINTTFANKNYARLAAVNTFTANQVVQATLSANQLISAAPQGTAPLQVSSTTLVPNLNASLLGGFAANAFQPAGSYATLGSNSFNGNQSVTGNVTASGTVTGNIVNATTYQLGGSTFGFGSTISANAFLGFAGNATTTGAYETGVGYQALFSDTSGPYNTAVGYQALYSNTTGASNGANGWSALFANTTGSLNTATGTSALEQNTTGWDNPATGVQALFSNTTGQNNSAHGTIALNKSTTGNDNTGDGFAALFSNTTGNANTSIGSGSGQFNATGSNNTTLGFNAGTNTNLASTTGSGNTFLGSNTSSLTQTNLTNAAAVGANAAVTANNSMVLGSINGVNGAVADTNVGIGTTAPLFKLDVHGNANFTGAISFAPGQTFPGTGTITGVTAGTDLLGGGTTGSVTLNLDTTKVPQLNSANTFTGNQTVNGNLSSTGVLSGSSYQIGSNLFAFGSFTSGSAYLGFAGNAGATGVGNTATGYTALSQDTTGCCNTVSGWQALGINTTGSGNTSTGWATLNNNTTGIYNTAMGYATLEANDTGSYNTAVGMGAGPGSANFKHNNTTAIGARAEVDEDNAMVLGSINGVNGATADTLVGIGTTTPAAKLDVHGNANFTGLITFAPGQTFPGTGTITGVTAGTDLTGGGSSGSITLNLDTTKVPQLNTPNTFNGTQTVNGNVAASGYQIGASLFAFGNSVTQNTFLGFAGNTGVTGNANTGTGANALVSLTNGIHNSAHGVGALGVNTSGSYNVATGTQALAANSVGNDNTALGEVVLGSNTQGSFNTGVGAAAMLFNTIGTNNTATGYESLFSNVSGNYNTATGVLALFSNTSGLINTATGYQALYSNDTGGYNTASGYETLYRNTSGKQNTALGMAALIWNTTGSNNTGVGWSAGPPSGHPDLTNATAIGAQAEVDASNSLVLGSINGVNNATADTNVGVGTTAPLFKLHVGLGNSGFRVEGPATGTQNPVMASFGGNGDFGVDAPGIYGGRFIVKDGGKVGIGTAFPDNTLSVNGSADKPGGGSWGTFSDSRLKTVHGNYSAGLDQILKLRPIRYQYKKDNAMGIRDADEHVGFVAQDVQKVIPEAVTANDKGYLIVNNDPILWTMLNAIKEQQQEIAVLRAQLHRQSAKDALLESRLAQLENSRPSQRVSVKTGKHFRKPARVQTCTHSTPTAPGCKLGGAASLQETASLGIAGAGAGVQSNHPSSR